jgi:hypothetical protein
MFGSYFRTKRVANLSLAFVFFWIGIHSYAFAIPTLIEAYDMKLLAYGYIIGIGMIFLTMLSGIEVQAFMARRFVSDRSVNIASIIITILGTCALSVMIYDLRLPMINNLGIILWNVNPLAQWIIGLTAFFYGFIWGYVFYNAALLVDEAFARVKLLVMSADGFIIGSVALLVHTSSNEFQTVLGHGLFIITGIITLGIYLLPKRMFEIKHTTR